MYKALIICMKETRRKRKQWRQTQNRKTSTTCDRQNVLLAILTDSLCCCTFTMTELTIIGELLQRQESFFFQESFRFFLLFQIFFNGSFFASPITLKYPLFSLFSFLHSRLFFLCRCPPFLCFPLVLFILLLEVDFGLNLAPFWGCLSIVLHALVCFIGSLKPSKMSYCKLFAYPLTELLETRWTS